MSGRFFRCLLLPFFLLMLAPSALAMTVEVGEDFRHAMIGPGVDYVVDPSGRAALSDLIEEDQWLPFDGKIINFGFSNEVHWVRFGLSNQTPHSRDLIAQISFPFLDNVQVFLQNPHNGRVQRLMVGDQMPASERALRHSHFLLPLALRGLENVEVFIRIESIGTLRLPLEIWSEEAFVTANHVYSLAYGALMGLLGGLALYHLLIWTTLRDRAMLAFSVFAFGMIGSFASLEGVVNALFYPDRVAPADWVLVASFITAMFGSTLFTHDILDVEEGRPTLSLVLKGYLAVLLALAASSLVLPFLVMIKLVLLMTVVTTLLTLTVTVIRAFDLQQTALQGLIGVGTLSFCLFLSIAAVNGIVPMTPFTEYAAHCGFAFMMMTFAFSLSWRMKVDRDLREQAKTELLHSQRRLNEELDAIVKSRTEALEEANRSLKEMSVTDSLTGLRNRRYFDEVMQREYVRAYREGSAFSVLLLDLDHFKNINDTFGHPFGDACLVQAANIITTCIRRPPDIAARYGGEEFVVLLPGTPIEGAVVVAEKIVARFREAVITLDDASAQVTVSIGACGKVPQVRDGHEAMLKLADDLLYQAKNEGRDRVKWQIQPASGELRQIS